MSPPPAAPPLSGKTAAQTLGVGFGAGLVNGLVGIGGGLLIVPGLVLVRGLPPKVAVATSLGGVMILSTLALAFHLWWSGMYLDPTGVILLLATGIVTAQLGSWLLGYVTTRWLLFIFSAVTLLSALQLMAIALDWMPPLMRGVTTPPLWSYPLLGGIAGIFSGMLGIGGGGLVVLGFSVIFRTPVLGGLPVALAVNVANALSAVVAQWRSGRILWREVGYLIPTAVVGVAVGTGLAIWLPPNALRIVFALFFTYMGSQLLRRALRVPGSAPQLSAPQK